MSADSEVALPVVQNATALENPYAAPSAVVDSFQGQPQHVAPAPTRRQPEAESTVLAFGLISFGMGVALLVLSLLVTPFWGPQFGPFFHGLFLLVGAACFGTGVFLRKLHVYGRWAFSGLCFICGSVLGLGIWSAGFTRILGAILFVAVCAIAKPLWSLSMDDVFHPAYREVIPREGDSRRARTAAWGWFAAVVPLVGASFAYFASR